MFEWCSISVMSTSSPLPTFARPNVCATRLIASVVPRTKMISREFRRVEELLHLFARLLVRARRALAQKMHAAMDIGVVLGVAPHHRVDDRLRLLRGGGVVEIDERLAVNRWFSIGKSRRTFWTSNAEATVWLVDMGQPRRQHVFEICRAPARS